MAEVIKITQPRFFTLEEARGFLPVIRKITKEALDQFLVLEGKLRYGNLSPEKGRELEGEIGLLLNKWGEKINKLGCHAKGIWLVDFDNGEGYYCWRYDESNVEYFHGYEEGFSGRTPIH